LSVPRSAVSGSAISQSTSARATFDPAAAEAALLARCEQLVERARSLGADEAEASGVQGRSISVRFEKGDLKLAQVDLGTTIGLRVFRGKRLGFTSTNQTDDRALETCAKDALTLAGFSPPDPHNVLPAARAIRPLPPLVDSRIVELPVERAVEIARAFVERSKARDARLSIDSAGVESSAAARAIATTAGVRASESDASLSLTVFGMAIDGDDVGGFHYTGDALRRLDDLETTAERCAEEFSSVCLGNLGARAGEAYAGPVIFAPDAFLEVFVDPLVSAASAIAVQRGRSPLAGKVGTVIAAPALEIVDDATDLTLAGAGAFDREGQPSGRFPIVAGGVLRSLLYNGYAAAFEGRASTGHASGSPRSVPGLGPHAIAVAGGHAGSKEELLRALGRGLFVRRFSGTVDPASGDFSGVAKSARWIEGGAEAYPVRETLIAGNLFALLPRIVALSSETERCSGAARAPYACVDGLRVTAG
jgi:PmbA protein